MITLQTKNPHAVPFGRGVIQTPVYLKISDFQIDENGIIPHGYYYILQQGQPHKLDDIVPHLLSWETITLAENQFSEFENKSLKEAIYQRAREFAFAKLQSEGTQNYQIAPSDWQVLLEAEPSENKQENSQETAQEVTITNETENEEHPI